MPIGLVALVFDTQLVGIAYLGIFECAGSLSIAICSGGAKTLGRVFKLMTPKVVHIEVDMTNATAFNTHFIGIKGSVLPPAIAQLGCHYRYLDPDVRSKPLVPRKKHWVRTVRRVSMWLIVEDHAYSSLAVVTPNIVLGPLASTCAEGSPRLVQRVGVLCCRYLIIFTDKPHALVLDSQEIE